MAHPQKPSLYPIIRRSFLLLAICLSLLLPPGQVARADTPVCEPLTESTTWTIAGNDYNVNCNVTVPSGMTLTIQPGVVVKFDAGTSLIVNGTLIASGATFTSSSLTPAAGDWGRIYFSPFSVDAVYDVSGNYLSGSKIQDSQVEYGGGGANIHGVIETNTASPFIYNNVIQFNIPSGIYAVSRSPSVRVVIKQNIITNNTWVSSSDYASRQGGGISIASGNASSNIISANYVGSSGGGIYATSSTVTGNTLSNNRADYEGAGIYASGSTITDNTITGNQNTGAGRGGGIFTLGGSISGNQIDMNTTTSAGGGIYASGNSSINNNLIRDNQASMWGAGIFSLGGTISGNTISGNSTTVESGGGIYAENSTISNNHVSGNSALNGAGIYGRNSRLTANHIFNNDASTDGGGAYLYSTTTASDNTISDNTAARGGGLFGDYNYGTLTISGNQLYTNTANLGAGIYGIGATINGNIVMTNTAQTNGGGIYAEGGALTYNTLANNHTAAAGHGAGAYLSSVTDFSYNSVITNTTSTGTGGGVSILGQPQMGFNNLHGNLPYDAEVISAEVVTATLNYWGAIPCTAIPAHIYDGHDSPGRGNLLYIPSLYSPAPIGQLASPALLSIQFGATSATLSWTPLPSIANVGCRVLGSSAPDIGYLVYYDNENACPPFNGVGLPQGDSPIDVGEATSITLTGLPPSQYNFMVTSYDYLGRESSYSNQVSRHALLLPFLRR